MQKENKRGQIEFRSRFLPDVIREVKQAPLDTVRRWHEQSRIKTLNHSSYSERIRLIIFSRCRRPEDFAKPPFCFPDLQSYSVSEEKSTSGYQITIPLILSMRNDAEINVNKNGGFKQAKDFAAFNTLS